MSRGLWLWEARSVVFYEAWNLQEVQALTDWVYRVVRLNKTDTLGSDARSRGLKLRGVRSLEVWKSGV